jgi:hypothetical protein
MPVHLAIANLGRLEAMEQFDRNNLAILVDSAPGRFRIDGQPIFRGDEQRYYFDPRLIVRGMEVVRGKHIGFALTPTIVPGQAVLYMSSRRENWRIHCALLSILPDEQTYIISQQIREIATTRLELKTAHN